MLQILTTIECTIKDSVTFPEELQSFDFKLVMARYSVVFDIVLLLTNIPLEETIDLCVANSFKDSTHVDKLPKASFRELLATTMCESLILFDHEFYRQHDGVAMHSPKPAIGFL